MSKETFKPLDYIKKHPANKKIVREVKEKVKSYIQSQYPKGKQVKYKDWYVGISKDPYNTRNSDHKSEKEISELAFFQAFWAYSLANARSIEVEMCDNYGMGNCHLIGGVRKESRWVYVYNLKLSKIIT